MTAFAYLRRLLGSPERDRLAAYLVEAWADLDRELHRCDAAAVDQPWARTARALLLQAEVALTRFDLQAGWGAALAGQRAILTNPAAVDRVQRAAVALHCEAEAKIDGWRGRAIRKLLCDDDGKVITVSQANTMRVIDAIALRDDASQNTWYKIMLRRRHLRSLFGLLCVAIFATVALAWWFDEHDKHLGSHKQVITVILFGALGAALSVAQSLIAVGISAKIPAQQIGAVVVWMRPAIGAAAALVVLALLRANEHLHLLGKLSNEPTIVVVFALLAGYSERFIVGALDTIEQASGKEPKREGTSGATAE